MKKTTFLYLLLLFFLETGTTNSKHPYSFQLPPQPLRWANNQVINYPKGIICKLLGQKLTGENRSFLLFGRYKTDTKKLIQTFLEPGINTGCAALAHLVAMHMCNQKRQNDERAITTTALLTRWGSQVVRSVAWQWACAEFHLLAQSHRLDTDTISWFFPAHGKTESIIDFSFDTDSYQLCIKPTEQCLKGICQRISKKVFNCILHRLIIDPTCRRLKTSGTFNFHENAHIKFSFSL